MPSMMEIAVLQISRMNSSAVHRFSTVITAIALLLHALLGCCWHHGHAHAMGCDHQHGAALAESACHEHSHEHDDAEDSQSQPQPDGGCPESCDEGSCVFVRAESNPAGQMALAGAVDFVPLPLAATHDGTANWAGQYVPIHLDVGPPVRTHLRFQVLLI